MRAPIELSRYANSNSRIPNPLFIVSHAHVNKKQRRIVQSMQNFSHVVRCDAFMPQIRVVQALSATTKRSSPRYERRCNSGARKRARGAAAWPSSTLPVAMKRTTSSVWRRQTAASTMCASCQHHRFHADSAFGSCRQLLSFMPSIAPVHAEHRTRHADRRIRHTVSPTRHADEGRHPRLCARHGTDLGGASPLRAEGRNR